MGRFYAKEPGRYLMHMPLPSEDLASLLVAVSQDFPDVSVDILPHDTDGQITDTSLIYTATRCEYAAYYCPECPENEWQVYADTWRSLRRGQVIVRVEVVGDPDMGVPDVAELYDVYDELTDKLDVG